MEFFTEFSIYLNYAAFKKYMQHIYAKNSSVKTSKPMPATTEKTSLTEVNRLKFHSFLNPGSASLTLV